MRKIGSWPMGADPLGNPNDPRDALRPYNRQEKIFIACAVAFNLALILVTWWLSYA